MLEHRIRKQHRLEQGAYAEIRAALTDSFIAQPKEFMEHFGCRPEDLNGVQLRDYYPHFLAQELCIKSVDPGFRQAFYEGRIF